MSEIVEYRLVPGYPGYRVGSDGTVWSRRRGLRPGSALGDEWTLRKASPRRDGYLGLQLWPSGKNFYVHRLVLELFVGPCPEGMQGCHFPDPDKNNNHLTNLRWDTSKANNADRFVHGTDPTGERNPRARLTERDVVEIRRRYAVGETLESLGEEFGVWCTTISAVILRKTWKHVP